MTVKQQQILGVQLEICRALIYHQTNYDAAVPFNKLAEYRSNINLTAMGRLLKDRLVKKTKVLNKHGGVRRGYEITPEGIAWYERSTVLYATLKKLPTTK